MQLGKDYDAASGRGDSTAGSQGGRLTALQPASAAATVPTRLLLVDDTPANLKILARLLEKRGYETELAEDGHQAVECFRSRDYDAILMDLQMPGLDGFGATRAIRAMSDRRQVPIIALTAHVVEGTRERCLEAGMSDYLAKPIDVALLTATIEMQVGGSR